MALDAVTGAFGFTGRHIARRLLAAGRDIRTLTGHPDRPNPLGHPVDVRPLPLDDPAQLAAHLSGVDTLYNTYWVRFARAGRDHDAAVAGSRALIAAAQTAGVRRFVHVSITGADAASPLPYFRGKGLVEQALRASALSWAIVRPTLIFGPEDVLIHNIAWILRRLPVFAVFGDGRYRVRPVHVEDLADLCVQEGAGSQLGATAAVGPERFTYDELVREVARAVGRPRPILHLPAGLAWGMTLPLGWLVGDVVVTRDEIRGLAAGLLDVEGPSTGQRRFSVWLQEASPGLGRRWVSEVDRHYRPPAGRPLPPGGR